VLINFDCPHLIILVYLCSFFYQGHPSFSSLPALPEEGTLPKESALSDNEVPEAIERRFGDDVEDSMERTDSNQSPPSASSKGGVEGRKRKHQEDLKYSGTSKSKDVPHDLATSSEPPLMPPYLTSPAQTPEFSCLLCTFLSSFILISIAS
jgi:hypothetical protein